MTAELVVWLVSLGSVFLVGWAWGRTSRPRRVYVTFPETSLNRLDITADEVRAAMRKDIQRTAP